MEGTQGDYKDIKRWRTLPDRMYNTIRRVGCTISPLRNITHLSKTQKIIRIKISYASWIASILYF